MGIAGEGSYEMWRWHLSANSKFGSEFGSKGDDSRLAPLFGQVWLMDNSRSGLLALLKLSEFASLVPKVDVAWNGLESKEAYKRYVMGM